MTGFRKYCVITLQSLVLPLTAHAAAPEAPHVADSPTLQRIAASGRVVLGHRAAACPFSCVGPSGEPVGYAVELCKRLVPAIQNVVGKPLTVAYREVTPANRIDAIRNGDIHVECGTTTITQARLQQVSFSYITYITRIRAMALPTQATKYRVADGRTLVEAGPVAYVRGTSTVHILEHLFGSANLRTVEVADYAAGIEKVKSGAVLSVIGDETLLADANKRAGGLLQWSGQSSYSVEPYGLPLPPNDPVFRQVINEALGKLYYSGEASRLLDQALAGLSLDYNRMTVDALRYPSTTAQVVW